MSKTDHPTPMTSGPTINVLLDQLSSSPTLPAQSNASSNSATEMSTQLVSSPTLPTTSSSSHRRTPSKGGDTHSQVWADESISSTNSSSKHPHSQTHTHATSAPPSTIPSSPPLPSPNNAGTPLPSIHHTPKTSPTFRPKPRIPAYLSIRTLRCIQNTYHRTYPKHTPRARQNLLAAWFSFHSAYTLALHNRMLCANCGEVHGWESDPSCVSWMGFRKELESGNAGIIGADGRMRSLVRVEEVSMDRKVTTRMIEGEVVESDMVKRVLGIGDELLTEWVRVGREIEEKYFEEVKGSVCLSEGLGTAGRDRAGIRQGNRVSNGRGTRGGHGERRRGVDALGIGNSNEGKTSPPGVASRNWRNNRRSNVTFRPENMGHEPRSHLPHHMNNRFTSTQLGPSDNSIHRLARDQNSFKDNTPSRPARWRSSWRKHTPRTTSPTVPTHTTPKKDTDTKLIFPKPSPELARRFAKVAMPKKIEAEVDTENETDAGSTARLEFPKPSPELARRFAQLLGAMRDKHGIVNELGTKVAGEAKIAFPTPPPALARRFAEVAGFECVEKEWEGRGMGEEEKA